MNNRIQKKRLPRCIVPRWIVATTITLAAIGGPSAIAQDDQPNGELSALSDFGQPVRLSTRVQAMESNQPQLQQTEDARSLMNRHRIDAIHERIALIKQLIEEEKANARRRLENVLPDDTAANGNDELQPAEPQPNEAAASPTEPQDASNKPEAVPIGSSSGTPVVSQPINPFELANSLFATGNIAASRRSYEAGLADATPEDQLWLKCMIGCCYRLEGDFTNAEISFREVARHKRFAYPVDYAKWCLKYLEQRRNSADQFQVIETELDNMLKEVPDNDGT